jgi:hypothetical protein
MSLAGGLHVNRVRILVEGQTEETFVNDILNPHLNRLGVYLHAFLFRKKGGSFAYQRARKEILNSLKEDTARVCTTMVDFYGMPQDWPGRTESRSRQNYRDKAQTVEQALSKDIVAQMDGSWNPARFIPYVQMHEFEALLFSDTSILAVDSSKVSAQLENILQSFSCPEEINDNFDTCPSRRIKQYIESYVKTVDGIIAARKVGLPRMRQKCPHFNKWVTKLESLGNQ